MTHESERYHRPKNDDDGAKHLLREALDKLTAIERTQAAHGRALAQLSQRTQKIMALLDELTAQVARNTDTTQSAITLLRGIKAKLDAAGTDPVALKALSDALGSNTDAMAAAIVENTPAEPA